jgi:exodeoxyribonuclease VII small subunit
MKKNKEKFDFNQGLADLEKIVSAMESGNLSLEESLEYFSNGVKLTKKCQNALNEAEKKINILTAEDNYNAKSTLKDVDE